MYREMDIYMDRQMDIRWKDKWIDGWIDRWIDRCREAKDRETYVVRCQALIEAGPFM
jgi:hypothetical protein